MSFRTLKLELQSFVPELNAVQVGLRINRAMQHLLDAHPWSFLKQEAFIHTVSPYTVGTIAISNGSTTVTGTSTVWTTAMQGRFIRFSTLIPISVISTVDAALQTLTLTDTYSGADLTTSGYTIFQRYYSKPTLCRDIISVRYDASLPEKTQEYLNTLDPNRESTGQPVYWSNVDNDTLELWPPPDDLYMVTVRYNKLVPDLSAESDTTLIPERLILSYARMASYMQLAAAQGGERYGQLYQLAKDEYTTIWQSAVEEDMRKMTLPRQVVQDGIDVPVSNEFWYTHDVLDPRGG
jgi:hypothetical protein